MSPSQSTSGVPRCSCDYDGVRLCESLPTERCRRCQMCDGTTTVHNTYTRISIFGQKCPRCDGTGVEPEQPRIHLGLILRHPRSGKMWAVYGSYGYEQAKPNDGTPGWGIHRMIPSRAGHARYVWQIRVFTERRLLAWPVVGFGDAWMHDLMESDPLREAVTS